MIVHIKMEFDLDTRTTETSKVQQQVTLLEGKHLCRRPACGNETALDKVYCCMQCFRAHGVRTRVKGVSQIPALDLPVLLGQPVAPSIAPVTHKCAWHECDNHVGRGRNGTMQKFCGRACYGKSRRTLTRVTSFDTRPVVDAVTGVITPSALATPKRGPGRPRKREEVVPRAIPTAPIDYTTFSFHQGVESCASS